MNAKHVLNKIIAALSLEKEEVALTYAKLADGTILESPTFDVGEDVSVVSEDGSKTPAPDGEHEVILKDSEGKDVRIKVITKDGKIAERENVELPAEEEAKSEELPVEKLPEDMESIAGEDLPGGEGGDAVDAPVNPIPEDMEKKFADLSYRIEEMEKKISQMEAIGKSKEDEIKGKPAEDKKEADVKMEEEELPKLDGAPIEETPKTQNVKFGKKVVNSQSSFLSKLYK